MKLSNSLTINSEYLRVTSHGVYSKEEGRLLHEPLFIFSQINKTMPLSKGQDDSIYICNKFLKFL